MTPRQLIVTQPNADTLAAWPVTVGVPLAAGEFTSGCALVLEQAAGVRHATQARVLTRHPDGSARRLLVHAEVPIAGPGETAYTLTAAGDELPAAPAVPLHAHTEIHSGRLTISSATGDWLAVFRVVGGPADGEQSALQWRQTAAREIDSGPVQATLLVTGTLDNATGPVLEARLTIRATARTPVVQIDVLLLNTSPHAFVDVSEAALQLSPTQQTRWTAADVELRGDIAIRHSQLPLDMRAEKLRQTVIGPDGEDGRSLRLLNDNETWLALSAEDGAQTVATIRNFFEYFPLGVRLDTDRITFDLWPAWATSPWHLKQGVGKTHELAVARAADGWRAQAVGYAVCKPPMARIALADLQAAGVFDELAPYAPNIFPRYETTLFDLTYNRNRGYGKMNWGDDYSALYTNQLRGGGDIVWNNLEGDHPFHMWRQFVRTGQFIYHRQFRDSILHWADVDFCDHRPDDRRNEGALIVHSAGHSSGSTSPCHNWAEGFREWYFASGDPRPLEILEKMADWLVRRAEAGCFTVAPEPYVRGCGWGLIQMAAIQEVLARADIRTIIDQLVADLAAYRDANDGLVMTIPTGGSRLPRDNAFHTATVVIGAYRCWRLYGDDAMRTLALAAAEAFMDERTCTPAGIAVYITGPEQGFPMQQAAAFAIAGLACAYELSADERYIRRGMRMLEYCLDRGMIVDHMRIPGEFTEIGDDVVLDVLPLMPNTQLLSYQLRGMLLFMKGAVETGLLRQLDYRF
jgi:hypothetical protein